MKAWKKASAFALAAMITASLTAGCGGGGGDKGAGHPGDGRFPALHQIQRLFYGLWQNEDHRAVRYAGAGHDPGRNMRRVCPRTGPRPA